ncbi:autophagy-related protein 13-domain-containing protein [Endogone sp. FLAS-F59071]|nr:autophagy-related protein 13-domain-containing protein [Endogone sp. FLAS-F59071]|eukprot:RUS21062.1 autophagy-related protein 13-domain-containing protein [Endogone sp. FLAS-F59071]
MSNPQNPHNLVSHDNAASQQDESCLTKPHLYHASLQDTPRNINLDQIIQNFYTKVVQVVIQARLTYHEDWLPQVTTKQSEGTRGKKTNDWFNLEMENMDFFKDELKFWHTMAKTLVPSSRITSPSMTIELYLDTSKLNWWQILVVMDEVMQMNRVDLSRSGTNSLFNGERYGRENGKDGRYQPKSILLERWTLSLDQPTFNPPPDLQTVYTNSIVFFRSLYVYVRLLPVFRLQRRLRKMNGLNGLRLGCRLVAAPTASDNEIPIDVPIVDSSSPTTSEYSFGAIDTPLGVFALQVAYRQNCDFYVDDSEHHLSSQFIDMDNNSSKPAMVEHRKELSSVERVPKRIPRIPFDEMRSEINTKTLASLSIGTGVSSVITPATPSPGSPYFHMDLGRLHSAKLLLKSRLRENPSIIKEDRFACNRLNFPYGDADLNFHLRKLQVPELLPFLRWIPLERFDSFTKLGRGGFAQVYKGTVRWEIGKYALMQTMSTSIDSSQSPQTIYASYSFDKKYALKEITPAMAAEIVLAVLLNFVRITVNLVGLSFHPRTGKYLLVMDCADGNLEEYSVLDRTTNSTFWARVWRICNELLSHLINMHEAHILHHDLHPGNVVLDNNEMVTVRLIDIGLGKVIGSKLKVKGIYGRLDYLPPEQFRSETYTEASEIYCLGTLMWQTITGVPPRGTAVSIQRNGLREDIPPGAPDTLVSIIRDCWNLNPSMRPRANDLVKRMVVVREEIAQLELLPKTKNFILNRRHMYETEVKTLNNKVSSTTSSPPTTVSSLISFADPSGVSVITSNGLSITNSQFYTNDQLKTPSTKRRLMTTRDRTNEIDTTVQQTHVRRGSFLNGDDGSPTMLMHLSNSPSSWGDDQSKNSVGDKVGNKVEDHLREASNPDPWTLDGLSEDNNAETSLANVIKEQPSDVGPKDGLSEHNAMEESSTVTKRQSGEDYNHWVEQPCNSDIWSMEAFSVDDTKKKPSASIPEEQSQDVIKLVEEDNSEEKVASLVIGLPEGMIKVFSEDVLEEVSEEVGESGAISHAIQLVPPPPVETGHKAALIRRAAALSKFLKSRFRQEGKNKKKGMWKGSVSGKPR